MQKEIKYRGISRAMSDIGVADGGLAECANMFLDRGELAPIVPPKVITDLPSSISYDLLYIHKSPGFTGPHYIALYSGSIYYVGDDFAVNMLGENGALDTGETVNDVKAVGNTLVVATSARMRYFLWTTTAVIAGAYKYLGSNIPSIDVKTTTTFDTSRRNQPTFSLDMRQPIGAELTLNSDQCICALSTVNGLIGLAGTTISYPGDEGYVGHEIPLYDGNTYYADMLCSAISRAVWTQIASVMSTRRAASRMTGPVFIRLALRLYDGSYIHQTVPILLGAEEGSSFIIDAHTSASETAYNVKPSTTVTFEEVSYRKTLYVEIPSPYTIALQIVNAADIKAWSDIIHGVDIFMSEPIFLNKYGSRISKFLSGSTSVSFESLTGDEKVNELLTKSNFYRIQQIDIDSLSSLSFQLSDFAGRLGDNLVVQPTLPDDYRSAHEVWPEKMYEMNNRLNILNVHTRYFLGPAYPPSRIDLSDKKVSVRYYIKGESGKQIVAYRDYDNYIPGAWLAYPDSRCYQADVYIKTISSGTWTKTTVQMKEHPFLNCAYSFLGFGIDDLSGYAGVSVNIIMTSSTLLDHAYNKIFQSEVDNPFFFPLAGRHTISGGSILGVASTTKALSQGQFGQFPLYVFCAEGIWAMETDSAGEFQSIKPVSRVVCNNADSITGIDGAVVFTSDRGLMIIAGSDVQCLSEDMIGKHFRADSLAAIEEIAATHFGSTLPGDVSDDLSFVDYAAGCFVGYDFANARLILVNPSCSYQYVYAIKDGTWHKMCFGLTFKKALNSYPELYMQCESNDGDAVYDFSIMDDVNDFTTRTFGVVITRALDFDQPYILKTILAMKHRGDFDKEYVGMLLYGSRDGINYIPVHSLKGKSFKFYRVALLAKLLPTERIDRTTVEVVDKFTNKLR